MDLTRIAVRAAVAFIYLLMMERVSGKRVVGQATAFDFVLALIIGDLVDDFLWAEVSAARFAGGVGAIFIADMVVNISASRSRTFFGLVNGRPAVVLRDGAEVRKEMRREQISRADIAHLLRLGGIDDWSKVKMALVDRGHDLSILRRWSNHPVQKKDRERIR